MPVQELAAASADPSVLWNFRLSPMLEDPSAIQLNIARFHTLQRMLGVVHSSIVEYEGERTEYAPAGGIHVGIDGSVAATHAVVEKQARGFKATSTNVTDGAIQRPYDLGWAVHQLNRPELIDRIVAARRDRQKPAEQVWAHELDMAVRGSFRVIAARRTLMDPNGSFHSMVSDSVGVTIPLGLVGNVVIMGGSPAMDAAYYGLSYGAILFGEMMRNRHLSGDSLIRQRRFSVFMGGVQPDRYLAANGLTRLPGLIKYRPNPRRRTN